MNCANVMQLDCAEFMTLSCAEFFSTVDLVVCPSEVRAGLLTGSAWAEGATGQTGIEGCISYQALKPGFQVNGVLRKGCADENGNFKAGARRV